MKNSNILNGFKNHQIKEVAKSVNIADIDSSKYDLFSEKQIKNFMHNSAVKTEGIALELQKGILYSIKKEINNLIPISISHRGKDSTFYISKTGACTELLKSVSPINKNENFVSEDIDKDKVLEFISQNKDGVDEDTLIDTFGEEVLDILNELEEEGSIEVDDEGIYFAKEDEKPLKEDLGNKVDGGNTEKIEIDNDKEEKPLSEEEEKDEEEDSTNKENNSDGKEENNIENSIQEEENKIDNKKNNLEDGNNSVEDKNEIDDDEETEKVEDNDEQNNPKNNENSLNENLTPEELEEFAKKTASVTLMKFYQNSNDKKLKEIAALELKSRGLNPEEKEDLLPSETAVKEDDIVHSDSKELNALEDFIKEYLSEYDKEDLVKYVVELANKNPAKRKELKDLYRKYYSANNAGNQALKIDEDDFKNFLTDHYFNNLTIGDLQSYAFLMISKNPKEYKRYKKIIEEKESM